MDVNFKAIFEKNSRKSAKIRQEHQVLVRCFFINLQESRIIQRFLKVINENLKQILYVLRASWRLCEGKFEN